MRLWKKKKKDADELLTLRTVGNKSNFEWKAKPWRKHPAKNINNRTEQRRESKSKKTKGVEWRLGPKSSRTLTVTCWNVEDIKCQQVPSLCFNLLVLLFCFFFLPSPLHSISTQLPVRIEEGGDSRAAGQCAHSSTLCEQEAMQILGGSLNPWAAPTCTV